jgi:hypothetical protein
MISRYNEHDEREVFDADGSTLIAVHGEFCTGCTAIRGTCGRLTQAAVLSGRISDPVALDRIADAMKFSDEDRRRYSGLVGNGTGLVPCAFCDYGDVVKGSVTYNGEYACKPCQPYAWASVVHPETREANGKIAAKRAAKRNGVLAETPFDRAQSRYDSAEPSDFNDCEHEEWETLDRITLTSSTQDVPIECSYKKCKKVGTFGFDGDIPVIDWDFD